jgi:hypothetical protein
LPARVSGQRLVDRPDADPDVPAAVAQDQPERRDHGVGVVEHRLDLVARGALERAERGDRCHPAQERGDGVGGRPAGPLVDGEHDRHRVPLSGGWHQAQA